MKKGLKRDTIDKFYTKSNIVLECLEHIDKYFEIKIYEKKNANLRQSI